MLKKTKSYSCIILLLLIFIVSIKIQAQSSQGKKSRDEINASLHIPEDKLTSLSTEELLNTYLNSMYICYQDIYSNIDQALEVTYKEYNGFRELYKRKDFGEKLIKLYKSMNPDSNISSCTLIQQGHFIVSFTYIENLFACDSIFNKLSVIETKTVLAELLKKNEYKSLHSEKFSFSTLESSTYSMAKLISSSEKDNNGHTTLKQNSSTAYLLKTGHLPDMETISIVTQGAKEFINGN